NHGMLVYDATLRVPWIMRGPGIVAGRRLQSSASQLDLVPTVLDLLGIDRRTPATPGRSWKEALGGGREAEPADRPIYGETLATLLSYGWAPLHSLRRGDWKLIDAPSPEI